MAGLTKLSVAEVHVAIGELIRLGLVRDFPSGGLVPVSPDEAVIQVVGPMERDLRTRRVQIEETRQRLLSFNALFDDSLTGRPERSQVEFIDNLDEVRLAIAELSSQCGEEILTAQPGGGRREEVLVEAAPRDYDALRRGVEMRMLYQHTARSSLGTKAYVEQVTRLGGQVRTLADQFTRMIIFDRECALFSVPGHPHAAALVQDPLVVAFILEAYERMWLAADPYPVGDDTPGELNDELKRAIIRHLITGMTDDAVARRLGMSVRTCRRHVAEIMAALGAESRFQVGYLLGAKSPSS
jgi:hypothetical protein